MKAKRTVLSGILAPAEPQPMPAPEPPRKDEEPRRRSRPGLIQQTVYLPPAVHEQLRELAFTERVKMHAILMEGLDLVFQARGLKSIADLTREQ
jgi:hypothetical protein